MHPHLALPAIPSDTIKTARAIMGRSNFYLLVGNSWESLITEVPFFNNANGEASRNWIFPTLAISTLLQYKEKLSDRQVEEASRLRVDWKYALHLSVHYTGLSRVMLCNFRQQIYHNSEWQREFQAILDRFIQQGLLIECQEASLTAVALLEEVCSQSRLEEIMLVHRRALEALATDHPKWLRNIILPHWYTRYHLFKTAPDLPNNSAGQGALVETIGADIRFLFEAISRGEQPELSELEEIKALHQTWLEQFEPALDGRLLLLDKCSFCGSFSSGGGLGG